MDEIMEYLFAGIIDQLNHWILTPATSLFNACFGTDQLESIEAMLHLANGASPAVNLSIYYEVINGVFTAVRPLGYALITTFFLISIMQTMSRDALTVETLSRSIIQLIIVITIAGNAQAILNAILSIGESLLNVVITASEDMYGSSDNNGSVYDNSIGYRIAHEIAYDGGANTVINPIAPLFMGLFSWVLHQVVVIGVDIAAFSRLLDIGWRAGMTPVGIANSFEGGAHSQGVQYLKNFAAAVLAGALMYVVAVIGFSTAAGVLAVSASGVENVNFCSKLFQSLGIQLATVGACIAAPNKAKELIG